MEPSSSASTSAEEADGASRSRSSSPSGCRIVFKGTATGNTITVNGSPVGATADRDVHIDMSGHAAEEKAGTSARAGMATQEGQGAPTDALGHVAPAPHDTDATTAGDSRAGRQRNGPGPASQEMPENQSTRKKKHGITTAAHDKKHDETGGAKADTEEHNGGEDTGRTARQGGEVRRQETERRRCQQEQQQQGTQLVAPPALSPSLSPLPSSLLLSALPT